MSGAVPPERISYVLPLRWDRPGPIDALSDYLASLGSAVDEIIVVDGSPDRRFRAHAEHLPEGVEHRRPEGPRRANGKVAGVITGVHAARNEWVIVADDDVRYDTRSLAEVAAPLADADLVRPQNYFDPLPWHARVDTARSLLNRVGTGDRWFPVGDFPGTFALRRSRFVAVGGYDGDALFENLELMRTTLSAGGTVCTALGVYVARRPPNSAGYVSQRVRQAYDDLAIPVRLVAFLAIAPAVFFLVRSRRFDVLALLVGAIVGTAETGRRRARGDGIFPVTSSLLAPVWLLERSVSIWIALCRRATGGVPYAGGKVKLAANPVSAPSRCRPRSPRACGCRRRKA